MFLEAAITAEAIRQRRFFPRFRSCTSGWSKEPHARRSSAESPFPAGRVVCDGRGSAPFRHAGDAITSPLESNVPPCRDAIQHGRPTRRLLS